MRVFKDKEWYAEVVVKRKYNIIILKWRPCGPLDRVWETWNTRIFNRNEVSHNFFETYFTSKFGKFIDEYIKEPRIMWRLPK